MTRWRKVKDLRLMAAARDATQAHDAWEAAQLRHDPGPAVGIALQGDERVYLVASGAGLLEPRRGPGWYESTSIGSSVRITNRHTVRKSAAQGVHTPGVDVQTLVDNGTYFVTSRRCIFTGPLRTAEWAFSKLVGHDFTSAGRMWLNVSNRQKTTGVHVGLERYRVVCGVTRAAIAKFEGPAAYQRLLAELEGEWRHCYDVWQAIGDGRPVPVGSGQYDDWFDSSYWIQARPRRFRSWPF